MRKIYNYLILLTFLGISQFATGQFYDGFTGTGNIGGNCIDVTCNSNGWYTHNGTLAGTIDITAGSLTYAGLQTSTGNKVLLPGANATTSRDINAAITISGNVVYYSALINIQDATQLSTAYITGTSQNTYFMHLAATAGNTNVTAYFGRLGVISVNAGSNFRLGITNTTSGTLTYTEFPTDLNFATTYLVVVKFDKGAAPTVASLWVNPTSLGGAEPTGQVTNNSGTGTVATFGSICLRNATSTPKTEIDEIRVGTDWASVTPSGGANVAVTSITVTGAGSATTITTAGGTLQMNAAVLPVDATNQTVTWSVTNGTGSATINSSGLLTAVTNGIVTVKATANDGSNVFGTLDITISNQPVIILVSSITVTGAGSATTITTAGGTLQMSAAVLPVDATNQTVTWSVTNGTGSATINSTGLLTAVTDGIVTVKATANDGSNVFGTLDITISNQPAIILVTSIAVTGAGSATTITTLAGTLQMSASVLPVDATNQTVTWSVNPSSGIASINTSGLLTATGNGVVTVKALANDASGIFGTLDITVSNQSSVTGSHRDLPIYRYFNSIAPDSTNTLDSTDITYGGWSAKSIIGTANWAVRHFSTNYYAECSGFNGTNSVATEAWLISPGFTIPSSSSINLKFSSCQKFNGNPIVVYVSTNYDGIGLPATATWTDITGSTLPPLNPSGPRIWKNSGNVSLSAYTGTNVHVAFKYTCDATNSTDWELDSLTISNSTGIFNLNNAKSISVYPNPAKESITIKNLTNATKIEILNIIGQVVKTYANTDEEATLNLTGFNKGIYFISIIDNNGVVKTVKFIKE